MSAGAAGVWDIAKTSHARGTDPAQRAPRCVETHQVAVVWGISGPVTRGK